MNIKVRLSFQFTLIVAGILLFFSLLVYYFSYTSHVAKFRQNLLDRAKNTAVLLIDVSEVDSALLKKIHQSTISLDKEELVLTDSTFTIIYSNNIKYLSDKTTLVSSAKGNLNYFSINDKDGVCIRHNYNSSTYYAYAMATDMARYENLKGLRGILFWCFIFSIWLSVLFSYLFSKKAIKPISRIIKRVKEINSLKLNSRLDEGERKDEIDQLAITFNEMLANLEVAFKNQEDFISNASHELRTPITIMIGGSDYLLSQKRNEEEFITHITDLVKRLKEINSLLNCLLELAQLNQNNNIQLTDVRIDEIVFNSIHQIKTKYPGRKVIPQIIYPEDESELHISGNAGLLVIAFTNIIDNACKFSDAEVIAEFVIIDKCIKIIISDSGIGIPQNELKDIYQPFKRASNAKFKSGFGIGLSLVNKIMELHDATLQAYSTEKEGTRFELIFKMLNKKPTI
jgi:signal transduction histidine kinase